MRSKIMYTVHGQLSFRTKSAVTFNRSSWFAEIPKNKKWRSMYTAVDCKTYAHALAQYRRLMVGTRQIDVRQRGCKPRAFKYD